MQTSGSAAEAECQGEQWMSAQTQAVLKLGPAYLAVPERRPEHAPVVETETVHPATPKEIPEARSELNSYATVHPRLSKTATE